MSHNHHLIKDLLALYADDMVSHNTKEMIRDHLESCTECRQLISDIREENHLSVLPPSNHVTKAEENLSNGTPFIKRLKKLVFVLTIISSCILIMFVVASWISGKITAKENYKQEELANDQKLIQIDNELVSLSPTQEEIYKKTGVNIHFLERAFSKKKSKISYQYTWNNPNIDYVIENIYWPNRLIAMDLTNNEVMKKIKNTTSTGTTSDKETWIFEGIMKNTEMVGIEMPNIGVFFKPPDISIEIKKEGITTIQKKVEVNHVHFLIKKAKIEGSRIHIYYEQLDDIKRVGLYELSFSIKDDHNKQWDKEPKIDFQMKQHRVAKIPLYKEMVAPYHLQLEHAVLIVPGMHYKFSVTSSR